MRSVPSAAMLLLALLPARASSQEASAPGTKIPEEEIARLQAELGSRSSRSSSVAKRRTLKNAIRTGQALVEARPAAPNRYRAMGIVLQCQKNLLGLESTASNRAAIFETCEALSRAPDECAELRLEADMLLMERDLASRRADVKERAQALMEMIPRYRGTPAEGKSLMIGVLIARQLADLELEEKILATMDDRCQGDHKVVEFRRAALKATVVDAVFSGAYECTDGTSLSFPVDRLGHNCVVYFWSQDNPHIDEYLLDVKAQQDQFPGQFEVYSLNVDELPDAGEARLRKLGLDWKAMRLPGGRKSSTYRAYARKDPAAILVNPCGHAMLMTAIHAKGVSLIPPRPLEGGGRSPRGWGGGGVPSLGVSLDDERYLSQLQSLFIGDFLVIDPTREFDPGVPPELSMVAMGRDVRPIVRDTEASVPDEAHRKIQSCFTPPPFRYRLTRDEALANYEKAERLCADAIAQHPAAADLWLVRNRRIVALMGLWNLRSDPSCLERAAEEARTSLSTDLPPGADVVPRFCLAKDALRRSCSAESVLSALVEKAGGDNAPASAYAAAAALALDANARGLHARYRSKLLDAPDDGNPMLWSVTSFLRDQNHTYRLFHATHGRFGHSRTQRHQMWRNVAALDKPAEHRLLTAEFNTLDGGKLRIPQDTAGKLTLVFFLEPPADEKGAAVHGALAHDCRDVDVIVAWLSDDAEAVGALMKKNEWECRAVMVPGGLSNQLVLRLGILSADRMPNLVLLRPDGTISWAMSGLSYHIHGNTMANTTRRALDANIRIYRAEAATEALEKGEFQKAVRMFSAGPGGIWASFMYRGRAHAYMGLGKWEKALADIDAAINTHRVFSMNKTFHCARIAEMELARAAILEKLGRKAEAEAERKKAAAPTFEHPRIPFEMYGDESQLKRLGPH